MYTNHGCGIKFPGGYHSPFVHNFFPRNTRTHAYTSRAKLIKYVTLVCITYSQILMPCTKITHVLVSHRLDHQFPEQSNTCVYSKSTYQWPSTIRETRKAQLTPAETKKAASARAVSIAPGSSLFLDWCRRKSHAPRKNKARAAACAYIRPYRRAPRCTNRGTAALCTRAHRYVITHTYYTCARVCVCACLRARPNEWKTGFTFSIGSLAHVCACGFLLCTPSPRLFLASPDSLIEFRSLPCSPIYCGGVALLPCHAAAARAVFILGEN